MMQATLLGTGRYIIVWAGEISPLGKSDYTSWDDLIGAVRQGTDYSDAKLTGDENDEKREIFVYRFEEGIGKRRIILGFGRMVVWGQPQIVHFAL